MNNTDDDYGSGTQFYINNELYKTNTVGIQRKLTTQAYLQSPKFEVKKAENPSNNSSGNSASSSRGNSGSSSPAPPVPEAASLVPVAQAEVPVVVPEALRSAVV